MSGVGDEDSVAGQEAWEGSQEETSDPETEGWEHSFKCMSVMCSHCTHCGDVSRPEVV